MPPRVFVLSPADCRGVRARILLRQKAAFPLACRLRTETGAPLGEVFAFLSGLYFRGKLAYARRFASAPDGRTPILVITPGEGLRPADEPITVPRLRAYGRVTVDPARRRYRDPVLRDLAALVAWMDDDAEVVLLGSLATEKYVSLLAPALGSRLRAPAAFVGLGDMARGGLLLRCVREDRELDYRSVAGPLRSPGARTGLGRQARG